MPFWRPTALDGATITARDFGVPIPKPLPFATIQPIEARPRRNALSTGYQAARLRLGFPNSRWDALEKGDFSRTVGFAGIAVAARPEFV